MEYEDRFNPLKLYKVLRDLDIKKVDCIDICGWYNENYYQPVKDYIEYGLEIKVLKGGEKNG